MCLWNFAYPIVWLKFAGEVKEYCQPFVNKVISVHMLLKYVLDTMLKYVLAMLFKYVQDILLKYESDSVWLLRSCCSLSMVIASIAFIEKDMLRSTLKLQSYVMKFLMLRV